MIWRRQPPKGRFPGFHESMGYELRNDFGNLEANLRFLQVTDFLKPQLKLLEVGAGKGSLVVRLSEAGCDVSGCEVSEFMLAESRRLHGRLRIAKADGIALPYPAAVFDAVLSFDVLDHIPDTDAHLAEVRRVLKPGGSYLLQTPNKWTNTVFETIRWRSLTAWREDHCSLHSYLQLKRRFGRHGFAVTFYDIPVVNEFFARKIRHYLGAPGELGLKLVNPDRLPLPFRTNFYLRATLHSGPLETGASSASAAREGYG